jgi:hypothetical protein
MEPEGHGEIVPTIHLSLVGVLISDGQLDSRLLISQQLRRRTPWGSYRNADSAHSNFPIVNEGAHMGDAR